MSVVNKMLQDLESRQNQQHVPNTDYQPSKKSQRPILILFILLVLLLCAGGFWWFNDQQTDPLLVDINERNLVSSLPVEDTRTDPAIITPAIVEQPKIEPAKIEPAKNEPVNNEPATSTQQQLVAPSELAQTQVIPPITTPSAVPAPSLVPDKKSTFEVSTNIDTKDTKESLKQQIHVALQLNDEAKAINLLQKLISKDPANQVARKKLAAMLFAQANINQSKQIILDGIALSPDSTELRMMLARLYVQQNNKLAALNTLTELNISASIAPNYVSFRASLAKSLERYEQAKSDYKNLLLSQPSSAKWWLGLAVSEEKLGNQTSALLAYRKVNELDQLSVEVATFVQQRIEYLAGVI